MKMNTAYRFDFYGGEALAAAGIQYVGEPEFRKECVPIYEAICKIHKTEFNEEPCVAYLAEALQFRTKTNLEHLAKYGLDEKQSQFMPELSGCYALAIRAEAVLRVLNGAAPEYRALVHKHDVISNPDGILLMRYDRDVMEHLQRRKK